MAGDRFDFNVATTLVQTVEASATVLEMKNEAMKQRFGHLREGFKDAGYDDFALDMSAADISAKDVIQQMRVVAKHISAYAERLKNI